MTDTQQKLAAKKSLKQPDQKLGSTPYSTLPVVYGDDWRSDADVREMSKFGND